MHALLKRSVLRLHAESAASFLFFGTRLGAVAHRLRFDSLHPKIETEEKTMTKINLREYYPELYKKDYEIEAPDEVAALMLEHERREAAYRRRVYYHKAQYSLDRGDGIEHDALFVSLSPCEIYERKVTMQQLHAAITSLPDKQAKRIYAYYFMGMSFTSIAKSEGVSRIAVSTSIQRALYNMEVFLKNRI